MVTKLVILLVIVLGVVAIAQLMRVYELSSKLRNKNEAEISNRDNRFNAAMILFFMIGLFGSLIWLMVTYGWTGRGPAASVHGHNLDWLLNLNFIIILAVFFLTNFLLFFFAFKYVRKPGVPAFYYPHNNKLEMLWTVVPAVVLAVIIILGLKSWNDATDEAAPESIRVELFSKQFDWTARYSGADNTLGKFDYKATFDGNQWMTANNELALITTNTLDTSIFYMEQAIHDMEVLLNNTDTVLIPEVREKTMTDLTRKERLVRLLHQMRERHDPAHDILAWDDIIVKDTLYLCKGREFEFNFRSKDVIHSAYFPNFRAQMNTVPGMTTRFKFIPDMTTEEMRAIKKDPNFDFVLLCNKICGAAHYKMKMMIVVLEEDAYDEWMRIKVEGIKDENGAWLKKPGTFRDTYFGVEDAVVVPEVMVSDSLNVDAAMVDNGAEL
ncbi:MAG: cytochrome c oxidase subunit II transmembrane domain-containing protein [Crocinitomicaceae bacterium]|nr:cytochrome c oxidase subunit II transmembrane domain-containing protein [Crocinitomicaceae bacterium]